MSLSMAECSLGLCRYQSPLDHCVIAALTCATWCSVTDLRGQMISLSMHSWNVSTQTKRVHYHYLSKVCFVKEQHTEWWRRSWTLLSVLDRKKILILFLSGMSCNLVFFWCVKIHINRNINCQNNCCWCSECPNGVHEDSFLDLNVRICSEESMSCVFGRNSMFS